MLAIALHDAAKPKFRPMRHRRAVQVVKICCIIAGHFFYDWDAHSQAETVFKHAELNLGRSWRIRAENMVLRRVGFVLPLNQCLWWHLTLEERGDERILQVCAKVLMAGVDVVSLGVDKVARACANTLNLSVPVSVQAIVQAVTVTQ